MSRYDDYRSNAQGRNPQYRIQISDIGLNLANTGSGLAPVRGRFGPFEEGAENRQREVPIIYDDFSNGMGQGYRAFPNSYAFCINGYTRTPRVFMPGGKLTEVPITGLTTDELAGEITSAFEWGGDVWVGAGNHILNIPFGTNDPVDVYDTGPDTQIDSGIVYNGHPIFSTNQDYPNWQFLTGYDLSEGWKTAIGAGMPTSGAANYETYPYNPGVNGPVYLQKMVKVFQEREGIGGFRIFGNDTYTTYTQTQSTDLDQIIGDTSVYGASLLVGDRTTPITNIVASNRLPYFFKTDGVYSIESSGLYTPNLTPFMGDDMSPLNGISGRYFDGHVIVGTPRGVHRIDVASRMRIDVPQLISPSYYFANETPIFGLPVAMTTDFGWLVVAFYNGKDSHICYATPRENTLSNLPTPMIWHGSECTLFNQRVTMLFTTSVGGRPRMWIGTHDGVRMHLYWLSLPSEGNPLQDYLTGGGHEFAKESAIFLPIEDWKDASAKKVLRRFEVQADNLSIPVWNEEGSEIIDSLTAGELDFYANADAGSRIFHEEWAIDEEQFLTIPAEEWQFYNPDIASEWAFEGTVNTSPRASFIPSGEATQGYQMAMMIKGTLLNVTENTEVDPPEYHPYVIRSIKARAGVIVEQMEQREYVIELGHLSHNMGGGRSFEEPYVKFTRLYSLQNEGPVDMIDEFGERVLAKVEPGMSYQLIPERVGQPWTLIATVQVSILGRPFYWNTNGTFDATYAWSP